MHILLSAVSRFTGPTGICRHSANLALCLAETPVVSNVTVALGPWQEGYFRECLGLTSEKVAVVPVDVPNTSFSRNRWFAFGLPRLARRVAPDLVHVSFPVPVIRSLFAAPLVASFHDLYPYEYPVNFGDAFIKRIFLRRCAKASDGLLCVSHATAEAVRRHLGASLVGKPVAVVHNYVRIPDRSSARKPPLMDSRPFILTVAQHQKNKRLDLLVRAFSHLLHGEQLPADTRLVIAGRRGPETRSLADLTTSLGLESRVTWLDGMPDTELAWLYDHCDVFVVCSSIEGFCIPLAEALAHSCRVVCSDIPTLREVADATCTFLDIARTPVENLAAAITDRWSRPRPNAEASVRFSSASAARRCLQLYFDVLEADCARETVFDRVTAAPAARGENRGQP